MDVLKVNSKPVNLVLLVVLAVLVYFWLIYAEFLSLDDVKIIETLQNSDYRGISLFSGGADYYRPISFVLMIFELFLFGADSTSFHVVSVVFHIINALLVYRFAASMTSNAESKDDAAMIAALVFLVHPLVVEPVAWVAAQTDVFCTFFAILSLNLFFPDDQATRCRRAVLIALAFMASLLAKEASISFVVVIPVLAVVLGWKRRDVLTLCGLLLSAFVLYLYLRQGGAASGDSGISKISLAVATKPSLSGTVADFGFYLRKLVCPFPLNFAIVTIDAMSSILSFFTASVVAAFVFIARREFRIPLLIIFGSIVPPLFAKLGKLPWTPYAERYLYLAVVGFAIVVGYGFVRLGHSLRILLLVGVLSLAFPSMERASLWADQAALWQDVVEKSPQFSRGYAGLGLEHLKAGRFKEAEGNFNQALQMGLKQEYVYQNLAALYYRKHDYDRFEVAGVQAAEVSANRGAAYQNLGLQMAMIGKGRKQFLQKSALYYRKAYAADPKAQVEMLYHAAKLEAACGNDREAAALYSKFLHSPDASSSMFFPFAQKLHASLIAKIGS